ncbi:MAG: 2-amino-4-hydroxy-6-hydroxymethyldihydropteridine diphosphokinase [Phycisphaerales bacterium]
MDDPCCRAFIALGSNLGDRRALINAAFADLASLPGTVIIRRSSIIETDPIGGVATGPFLNAVIEVSTLLSPRALLDSLLAIERAHGRDRLRERRWGSRTLDLDLLLYGPWTIDEPGLTVPHPRLHERWFVLAPFAEIAADVVVPGIGRSIGDLFAALTPTDQGNNP